MFRPTALTIIGVILYLRQGWVVGSAGLLGGLAIVLMTFAITGATALSFSVITTNIRIGAGGAFAVVARSLGLEAGGALGIPMYLAQSLSVALYIHGFAEGWLYLFPAHPRALVLLGVFAVGFGLSLLSETLALRLQGVVMFGVALALGCMWGGLAFAPELHTPTLIGDFSGGDLWVLFAVFFPSGTGIMVGASLSGKLANPRRSIPLGVLSAWGVCLVVYLLTAIWYSLVASPQELQGNFLVAVDHAAWGPGVMIGLMSSCFSAMLGSAVAAPNVLHALAEHRLVPGADLLTGRAKGVPEDSDPAPARAGGGTPRRAVLTTAVIVLLALLLGSLNAVARMISMFFLLTYATINFVVLIEQRLDLISFRPTLRVPSFVPLLGGVGSVLAVVLIRPALGLLALAVVVVIYAILTSRRLETPWETVRSGIVVALADWIAKVSQQLNGPQYRAWKPDLLVPVTRTSQLVGEHRLLRALVQPRGSVQVLAIVDRGDIDPGQSANPPVPIGLDGEIEALRSHGLVANHAEVVASTLLEGVRVGTNVLEGSFLRPNVMFVHAHERRDEELQRLLEICLLRDIGFALLMPHEQAGLGREESVNIWVREQSPDWQLGLQLPNLDLALLLSIRLARNWGARIRLLTAVSDPQQQAAGLQYLARLRDEARLPQGTELFCEHTSFAELRARSPQADLHILGLQNQLDVETLREVVASLRGTCLFVHDSTKESALA